MTTRRDFLYAGLAFLAVGWLLSSSPAGAHHGWRWTADGNFELTGVIKTVKLGNPHGLLTVDAEGELWTVEVGQPWRHERVGLKDEMLAVGTEIAVIGHRSANPAEKVVKAERLTVGGQLYVLYPDRE
jgi:hypothetical protein